MRVVAAIVLVVVAGLAVIVAQQTRPEAAMRDAAQKLLAALDDGQRGKIQFAFDSEERFNWHFIPRERKGLSFKDMTEPQRQVALGLLKAGLSASGYTRSETIRSLENVLRAQSGSATRDPELYFFSIFGKPGDRSWGWRYEGHHQAQNWTFINGRAATTPAFLGANPANVQDGPMKGTRALPAEEDLAFALLSSLTDGQRKTAIIAEAAPNDILTSNTRKAAVLDPVGIAGSALNAKQQAILMRLIEEYATVQTPGLAEERMAKVKAGGLANVRFAWMGKTEQALGAGRYYRIQGPSFLIEYDNVQNNANHQHTVWRDFNGDFGVDVLAQHYATDPHHARR
jgi:hypothetical protein